MNNDIIDKQYYETRALHTFKDKDKNQHIDPNIEISINKIICEMLEILKTFSIQSVSTWLLDKNNWIDYELNGDKSYPYLGKGRVVNVNPGVDNIGREERFIHMYIVLAEYKETFIGIPITNAKLVNEIPVLRNELEVFLVNPDNKKPYKEFRCNKPSVADLRNIRCFDKSRIIKDSVYIAARIIPQTYKNSISDALKKIFTFS